jgi:hypothetical protein
MKKNKKQIFISRNSSIPSCFFLQTEEIYFRGPSTFFKICVFFGHSVFSSNFERKTQDLNEVVSGNIFKGPFKFV